MRYWYDSQNIVKVKGLLIPLTATSSSGDRFWTEIFPPFVDIIPVSATPIFSVSLLLVATAEASFTGSPNFSRMLGWPRHNCCKLKEKWNQWTAKKGKKKDVEAR